jgi:hypothetical protein
MTHKRRVGGKHFGAWTEKSSKYGFYAVADRTIPFTDWMMHINQYNDLCATIERWKSESKF